MIDTWKYRHRRQGYEVMQIYCRCSIGLHDLLKCIPVVVVWEKIYKFSNKLWCIFCSVHKVGGAQRPRFQVGGARAPKPPPRSYVPDKVYILFVDAVPIGLQYLKYIRSFFWGGECLQIFE